MNRCIKYFKTILAREKLQDGIGRTTLDESRKYIEKDAALERRFQPIHVDEPRSRRINSNLERFTAIVMKGPSPCVYYR